MAQNLTEQAAVQILSNYNAKVDAGNKVVRDANFLGNKLNGIVDHLVRNYGWARTTYKPPANKFQQVSQLIL